MQTMGVKSPEEVLYVALMLRWENVGVPDRASCTLDGEPAINSQIERMAYVLGKLGASTDGGRFQTLAVHTRRDDGGSYISRDSSRMGNPKEIGDGWFFEGNTSLPQKREILHALSYAGYSTPFVECCKEFVAGEKSVRRFLPTKEEAERMLEKPEPPGIEHFEAPPAVRQILLAALSGKESDWLPIRASHLSG
jgi:hypothetical protein